MKDDLGIANVPSGADQFSAWQIENCLLIRRWRTLVPCEDAQQGSAEYRLEDIGDVLEQMGVVDAINVEIAVRMRWAAARRNNEGHHRYHPNSKLLLKLIGKRLPGLTTVLEYGSRLKWNARPSPDLVAFAQILFGIN
ncbi:MAG: hypothetical protein ACYYK0_02075 [Candidatus Eutrophobiaceae bacterium]